MCASNSISTVVVPDLAAGKALPWEAFDGNALPSTTAFGFGLSQLLSGSRRVGNAFFWLCIGHLRASMCASNSISTVAVPDLAAGKALAWGAFDGNALPGTTAFGFGLSQLLSGSRRVGNAFFYRMCVTFSEGG